MENKQEVKRIFAAYLSEFKDENHPKLVSFLERCTNKTLYNRKTSHEHITASALIVNPEKRKILLIEHATFKKLLQPGGHIEKTDRSILDAALREAVEETRIDRNELVNYSIHFSANIPLDIDSHKISANSSKGESAHFHHDFRFLFFYKGDNTITPNPNDSTGVKWVSFSELTKDKTFKNLLEKIRKILSLEFKTKLYYDTVEKQFLEKKSIIQ